MRDRFRKTITTFMSLPVVMVASLLWGAGSAHAQSVTFSSQRNCDSNAVINCGAMSASELQNKYNADPTIQNIFNCFNITENDINNLGTTAQAGTVTRSGNVIVGGQTVAINATTAGRQFINGSTPQNCGGTQIYVRPPSVSFLSNQLDAFVVMANGRFDFAILASCGNPIEAAPTTAAAAPVAPPPVPPSPPVQQTTAPAPTPAPKPAAPKPTPQPQPKTLVNTGPGPIVAVFLVASLSGGAFHWLYRRRKHLKI